MPFFSLISKEWIIKQPFHASHSSLAVIKVTRVKYKKNSITFHVESNVAMIASCSLFNAECMHPFSS